MRAAAFLRYLQRWSKARSSAVATGGSALVAAGTVDSCVVVEVETGHVV